MSKLHLLYYFHLYHSPFVDLSAEIEGTVHEGVARRLHRVEELFHGGSVPRAHYSVGP